MTQQLTKALRDLADDLETGAVGPAPATVWRAGARRRWRRRGAVGLAVAAVVAVVALVVAPGGDLTTTPAGRDSQARVTAYPQRIGHQWWTPSLGDRPGPQAALLQSVEEDSGRTTWFTVSPSGERRRIPAEPNRSDVYPALSDDGRVLGYLAGPKGPYVLHDLATGEVRRYAGVNDGAMVDGLTEPSGDWVGGQTPAWFSPDHRRLALPMVNDDPDGDILILGLDGSRTYAGLPATRVAGWADATHIVGVTLEAPQRIWSYDVSRGSRSTGAVVTGLGNLDEASQWSFRLSADGRRLAVDLSRDGDSGRVVGVVDVASGKALELPGCCTGVAEGTLGVDVGGDNGVVACGPALAGGGPALNADLGGSTALVVPPFDSETVLSRVAPGFGARCIIWAQGALEGHSTWSLFGTSANWLTWWWREALLGVLLAGAAAVVLRRRSWRWSQSRTTPDRSDR